MKTNRPQPSVIPSFLDMSPPHWAARAFTYTAMVLFVVLALAAILIRVPETVSAPFTLVAVRGADPIKATRRGVVERVFVHEGDAVEQGAAVAIVKSESAGDREAELLTIETQRAGSGESFVNNKARFAEQVLGDEQEMHKLTLRAEHLESLIRLKRQQTELLKNVADSYEKLHREGIASRMQWTGRQLEFAASSAELERLAAEQDDARATAERLKHDLSARRAEFRELERMYREQLATAEIRVAALRDSLAGTAGSAVELKTPCSGTVLRLHARNTGAVLNEGDIVAEIVCAGETLQAELSVPAAGVGKLKIGQGVKLKYDAFPYQRYGLRYGHVTRVSPAPVGTTGGASFKASVDLFAQQNGEVHQPRPLLIGMGGTADIVIGTRTLINFVIEPLRQMKEHFSDVPPQISNRRTSQIM